MGVKFSPRPPGLQLRAGHEGHLLVWFPRGPAPSSWSAFAGGVACPHGEKGCCSSLHCHPKVPGETRGLLEPGSQGSRSPQPAAPWTRASWSGT